MARSTPAAKAAPAPAPVDPVQAQINAMVEAALEAALGRFAAPVADPPATETSTDVTPVDTRTPEGQPTLRNPDNPASLPQKRLWADLRFRAIAKNGTAAQKTAAAKALAAYTSALNAYLLASGVTGPTTVTMSDAQVAISELRA